MERLPRAFHRPLRHVIQVHLGRFRAGRNLHGQPGCDRQSQKNPSPHPLNKNPIPRNLQVSHRADTGESVQIEADTGRFDSWTRDVKRLPTVDELPQLVGCYMAHKAGAKPDKAINQASSTTGLELFGKRSINLRHYWSKEIAKQIGLLGADEDPAAARTALDSKMKSVEALAKDWLSAESKRSVPPAPSGWKTVSLGDEILFGMGIGRRVLKKDIYQKRTGVSLYSANIRKVFGFVDAANAGGLEFGGALWSIDSDFDCRGVSPGEKYAITDHCGQLAIMTAKIDPEYLGRQIRTAGIDYEFNRDFRPSLEVMATLEIDLPVTDKGEFDIELMRQWASYLEELDQKREEMEKLMA